MHHASTYLVQTLMFRTITRSYDPVLREKEKADMAVAIAGASDLR